MVDRARYPKSTCCIAGCPKWSRLFPGEWLCARHWRMLPRSWRAALRRHWRTATEATLWTRCDRRLWRAAKRRIVLREAGV